MTLLIKLTEKRFKNMNRKILLLRKKLSRNILKIVNKIMKFVNTNNKNKMNISCRGDPKMTIFRLKASRHIIII
jgi:hypothetical protein